MRREKRPVRAVKWRRRLCAGLVILFVCLILFWFEQALRPTINRSARLAAQVEVTHLLCAAAEESMAQQGDTAYTTVLYDTDGDIAAVEVSAASVNQLQNAIISRASASLHGGADTTIPIPLGAAGDMTLFSANGPTIRVKIRPHGAVTPQLESSFEEAGMNQTLHRLTLTLTCEVELIAPFCHETVFVEYPCLIAETLLVGNLPEYMLTDLT